MSEEAKAKWVDLCQNPGEARWWDWLALLRLIQSAHPDLPRIGYSIRPNDDPVRLAQPPFFHTPAFAIASLSTEGPRENRYDDVEVQSPEAGHLAQTGVANPNRSTPWLYSFHFGLFGPFGPMPLELTSLAKFKDKALAAFCDLFHHRFQSFFFRAWADSRKETLLDRPRRSKSYAGSHLPRKHSEDDNWELFLSSLIGLGLNSARKRDGIPDYAKYYFAGRLMMQTSNAEGLKSILEDYFDVPVSILTLIGRKVSLSPEVRDSFGTSNGMGQLGYTALIGESYEDCQEGFRIRFGPLSLEAYKSFLPTSAGFREVADWIRLYTGIESDPNPSVGLRATWDLQLVLSGSEVPSLELGTELPLGHATWLTSEPVEHEVSDLTIEPSETAGGSTADRRKVA